MKAEFTKFEKGQNWCNGVVGNYVFEAKSFDTGSIFGINDGRVSKLAIWEKGKNWNEAVVNYDRGWDIEPTAEVMAEYEAVMELLENAPPRF